MFGNSSQERSRQIFAEQFAPDGGGYLYRKGQIGPPIRVSETEKDRFIAEYAKRRRRAMWSLVAITILAIMLLAWLGSDATARDGDLGLFLAVVPMLAAFLTYHRWAWNAPSRELERRTPEGAALTRVEAQTLLFSKITYAQLGLGALFGLWLVAQHVDDAGRVRGTDIFWVALGLGLCALSAIQAFRKWRFESR